MRERGFTILESMVALAIILVGILAITQLQTTQVTAGVSSKQRVEATLLAQQVIEQYRAYATVPATAGVTAYEDIADGSDTVAAAGTSYARSWTVTNKTGPAHKLLVVSVGWTVSGKSEAVTLTTIIAPVDPVLSGRLISGT